MDSSANINSAVIESYKQYLDSKFGENVKVPEKTLTAELVDIYNSLEAQNGKTAAIEMMNNIAGYAEANYGKYLNGVGLAINKERSLS